MESRVAQHDTHRDGSGPADQGRFHGIARYFIIYIALMVLTVLTVVTGKLDLGAANIFVAMAIAITKASLVVLFFMHLWDEGGVNRLVFVTSLLFLAVLILGVFGDLLTRIPISLPNEGPMPALPQGSPGTSPPAH
jgi:cytochrome c oxidase subunit 4